jgi:hypothetical protein
MSEITPENEVMERIAIPHRKDRRRLGGLFDVSGHFTPDGACLIPPVFKTFGALETENNNIDCKTEYSVLTRSHVEK